MLFAVRIQCVGRYLEIQTSWNNTRVSSILQMVELSLLSFKQLEISMRRQRHLKEIMELYLPNATHRGKSMLLFAQSLSSINKDPRRLKRYENMGFNFHIQVMNEELDSKSQKYACLLRDRDRLAQEIDRLRRKKKSSKTLSTPTSERRVKKIRLYTSASPSASVKDSEVWLHHSTLLT
jgi:hypothetical protein